MRAARSNRTGSCRAKVSSISREGWSAWRTREMASPRDTPSIQGYSTTTMSPTRSRKVAAFESAWVSCSNSNRIRARWGASRMT